MFDLEKIKNHIRNRPYMSGIERDRVRVKATAEVFTPIETVQKMLDMVNPTVFADPKKTVLDQSAGDGAFLGECLIRKLENGIDFETALSTIYGVEKEIDNCELCRDRLLCGREDLRHIVEKNIVNADSTTYTYAFSGPNEPLIDYNNNYNNFFEEV